MELVEATAADVEALADRWYDLASAMASYDDLNTLVPDARAGAEEGFRAQLDDQDTTDYLVAHGDETIGFVTLREGRHPSREYAHSLRIVNLSIDEAHRGQGHGSEVVERVKAIARERDCDHLTVSCEWDNEGARRFYRDAEFRPKQVDYAQPLEGAGDGE